MHTPAYRATAGSRWPRSWLLIMTLGSVLAGCGNTSGQRPVAHVTPPVPIAATPFATAIPLPHPAPLTLQQAWGHVVIRALPTNLGNGRAFNYDLAATPDGQWLIGGNVPRNLLHTSAPSYAVLYNVATHQMVTMRQLRTPLSQIAFASADADWVVWQESDDNPTFFDWTMVAYNRHTGQTQQLGQAVKDASGQAVPGPVSGPVVDHNHVLWSQVIGPIRPANLSNAVVRLEDLTTGQVTTLATGAGDVSLSWPWASWAQTGPNATGYMEFRNLVTGQSARLMDKPTALGQDGTSVAYVDGTRTLNLINDVTKGTSTAQQLLMVPSDAYIDEVSMNQRLIGWNQDGSAEVYDRVLQRFVTLPLSNTQWSYSAVSYQLLVWADDEPAAQQQQDNQNHIDHAPTLYIIDSTTLPTSTNGA